MILIVLGIAPAYGPVAARVNLEPYIDRGFVTSVFRIACVFCIDGAKLGRNDFD